MKPTIIGDADGRPEDPKASGQPRPSPTIIGNSKPRPTAMPATSPGTPPVIPTAIRGGNPVAPHVEHPSSIPGSVRTRIPFERQEMQRRYGASDRVMETAMHIVATTNQDSFALNDALLWGQPLQVEHQKLVSETLALAQSETISVVTGHLHRLMTILEQIELEKVFSGQKNALVRMIGKATGKTDTPHELDAALRELEQLSTLLRGRIDELLTLRTRMEQNSRKIESIGNEIESSLIAAETIAGFFRNISRLDFAMRLEERMASLTVTLGQIRSGGLMRELHIEQPMNLTTLIQETVFNTLLSWMTSVIALRMALHGNHTPNPTEVREISRIKQTIEQKLRHQ